MTPEEIQAALAARAPAAPPPPTDVTAQVMGLSPAFNVPAAPAGPAAPVNFSAQALGVPQGLLTTPDPAGGSPAAPALSPMMQRGAEVAKSATNEAPATFKPIGASAPAPGAGAGTGEPPITPAFMPRTGPANTGPLKQLAASQDESDKRMIAAMQGVQEAETRKSRNLKDQKLDEEAAIENATLVAGRIREGTNAALQRASESMTKTNAELTQRMDAIKGIDPDHWWNTKSTGDKMRMSIALALSTFGSMMPHTGGGGKNPVMEMMQSGIHADIEAQKVNHLSEWNKTTKGLELNKDKLAQAQYLADRRDKDELFSWKKADAQIASLASRTDAANAQENAAGARAAIQGKIEELEKGMAQRRYEVARASMAGSGGGGQAALLQKAEKGYQDAVTDWLKSDRTKPAPNRAEFYGALTTGRVAGAGAGGAENQQVVTDLGKVPKGERDSYVSLGDGRYARATSPAVATKASDKIEGLNLMDKNLERLGQLIDKGSALSATERAQAGQLQAAVIGQFSVMSGTGQVQAGEAERYKQVIPGLTVGAPWDPDKAALVKNLRGMVGDSREVTYRALNVPSSAPAASAPAGARAVVGGGK